MIKILFLIHDLGGGGAEKVLVNLVNHMDRKRFEIHVMALFGGGVNEKQLASDVHYRAVWPKAIPGNSKLLKLLSPDQLHRRIIHDTYDIEVSYLEGPSARIISGCSKEQTKTVSWIHIEQHTLKNASSSFLSSKEAITCYSKFNKIVCVSEAVRTDFLSIFSSISNTEVQFNTIETDLIRRIKEEPVEATLFNKSEINLIGVGKIIRSKGFYRLARIVKRLRGEGIPVHFYALGVGPDQTEIENYLTHNNIQDYYTFLGYQMNPYKYIAKSDLFVCASMAEGFSTAATEALIIGTPVCTVDVSGMREMLGNNEYGIITSNDDESLYQGIKDMICSGKLEYYREKALERGKSFSTESTVRSVETMFEQLVGTSGS